MPINKRWPIANVLAQCRRYADRTGRRVFIEYLMLEGVNDSVADAKRLATILRDGRFHVNLIEYNATDGPYRGSTPERRRRFAEELSNAGLYPSIRRSRGADIAASGSAHGAGFLTCGLSTIDGRSSNRKTPVNELA